MKEKLKVLNGSTLKIFAMAVMLVDHMGMVLFPELIWMRIIGRLAFPIFAFFIAEGFYYTKNPLKYMVRMAVFAVVSEPFFDLACSGGIDWGYQNVMLTYLAAIVGLYILKKTNTVAGCVGMLAAGFVAELINTDYGCFGVLLVYIYYILRNTEFTKHLAASAYIVLGYGGLESYAAISSLPLLFYNGKKGMNLKYLFYAFYPVHLFILYLISK